MPAGLGAVDIEGQVRRNVGSRAETMDFGSVEWASRGGSPEGAEQTVGLAVFEAGKSNVEHVHPNCEEVVYVLEGEVEHTLGDQSTTLREGDLIVVPRGAAHRLLNNGPAPVRVYIVFSAPDRQFEPTGR
ncbi:MAG: cupin domain-containing protein [Dehalococcoidia bacterium]